MIQVLETYYTFSELSEKAQQRAIDNARQHTEYGWEGENTDSLNAFEAIFPIRIKDWSYGGRGEGVSFEMTCEDEVSELSGLRLAKYLWNNYKRYIYKGKYYSTMGKHVDGKYTYKHRYSNITLEHCCVLTGYCVDDDLLDAVYAMIDCKDHKSLSSRWQSTTFEGLMRDCLDAWVKTCAADMEYAFSDEAIRETLEGDDEAKFDEFGNE